MKKYRYKKRYKLKKRKSIIRWILHSRFFWLSFLFLVILGTVFYFLVFSSFFQIKEIKISGNEKIALENLKDIISNQVNKRIIFFDTKSIFLVNLKEINRILLEKFPQIARVKLNRKLPDVLAAQIEERKPVAILCFTRPSFPEENLGEQGEDYFFIDEEGIIFEKISEPNPEMLEIKKSALIEDLELGKEVIKKEKIAQILKIAKLKEDLKIPISEVLIVSEERLNVKTSENWEIYFNPEKDLNWQLTKLKVLLKERISPNKRRNLEYIDLRFEKIYIFPETYQQ